MRLKRIIRSRHRPDGRLSTACWSAAAQVAHHGALGSGNRPLQKGKSDASGMRQVDGSTLKWLVRAFAAGR